MAWTERYCSVAGGGAHDGTTAADAWTLAEAIAGVAAGQRVNVISGTYSNTTTTRTFATAGTTTQPIWWRGYNTTIGDLDDDPSTARPAITFTTGQFVISGAHQIFSSLDVSFSGGTVVGMSITGGNTYLRRCSVTNTSASSNSRAVHANTNYVTFVACKFTVTSTANIGVVTDGVCAFRGCTFTGGASGTGTGSLYVQHRISVVGCVFNDVGGNGILHNTGQDCFVVGCTFYSTGNDGIKLSVAPAIGTIINCIFSNCGGWGINNSTGGNINTVVRSNNAFYSNSSGTETGFGDSPTWQYVTETGSPFTNAGAGDLSLASGALSIAAGMPSDGVMEGQSYTNYLDIGAVQRQASSGGGNANVLRGSTVAAR